MLTLEQAKKLKPGDILIGAHKRWKVNGQVKLWKTDPSRIYIPIKHGLYAYGKITEYTFCDTFRDKPASKYWSIEK